MPRTAKIRQPVIQVRARPMGHVQWVCPDCHYIHGKVRANWRTGKLVCKHCRRRFFVGLAFTKTLSTLPPFNAVLVESHDGETVNTLGYVPEGSPAIGRINGQVQWQCPTCKYFVDTGQAVRWGNGALTCRQCDDTWLVTLILYRPPTSWRRVPFDFVPPDAYDQVQIPAVALPPEAPSSHPGADC